MEIAELWESWAHLTPHSLDGMASMTVTETLARVAMAKDNYTVLGVDRYCQDEQLIRRAYLKHAACLHPDKCSLAGAEEGFKRVAEAMRVLGDLASRARYETELRAAEIVRAATMPPGANWGGFAAPPQHLASYSIHCTSCRQLLLVKLSMAQLMAPINVQCPGCRTMMTFAPPPSTPVPPGVWGAPSKVAAAGSGCASSGSASREQPGTGRARKPAAAKPKQERPAPQPKAEPKGNPNMATGPPKGKAVAAAKKRRRREEDDDDDDEEEEESWSEGSDSDGDDDDDEEEEALESDEDADGGGNDGGDDGRGERRWHSSDEDEEAAAGDDDQNDSTCAICEGDGELLCCDSCPSAYHLECLDPPLSAVPAGSWYCPRCTAQGRGAEGAAGASGASDPSCSAGAEGLTTRSIPSRSIRSSAAGRSQPRQPPKSTRRSQPRQPPKSTRAPRIPNAPKAATAPKTAKSPEAAEAPRAVKSARAPAASTTAPPHRDVPFLD